MKFSNSFIEPVYRDVIKAAKEGDVQLLRSLLQHNIPAYILINALCYAVFNAHTSSCRILLDNGVDINGVGLYGSTPLLTVAGRLNFEIADLLLKRGADVNARNDIGRTPLLVAILNFAEMDILRLFLEAGADANIADNRGLTPLWATLLDNRNPGILRLLLQYGADASVTYFGKLPLDIARKNNFKRFEEILETPPLEHKPSSHVTT